MRKRHDAQGKHEYDKDLEKTDPQFVTALARGLEILSAFRPNEKELGNQEIAERTKLPKSTVSRLIYTLTCLNYLTYNTESGKYSIGFRALHLGYTTVGVWGLTDFIRPMMKELSDDTGVSVALGIPEGIMMHYIQVCRPENIIHLQIDLGSRLPMSTSAIGRAHAVSLPQSEKSELLRLIKREEGPNWPVTKMQLFQAGEFYNKHGFVICLGEWAKDVNSAATPIFLPKTRTRLALNIGGPSFMLSEQKIMDDYGPRMVRLAKSIERKLSD